MIKVEDVTAVEKWIAEVERLSQATCTDENRALFSIILYKAAAVARNELASVVIEEIKKR